jgi:signal transduction histidine kinase
MGCNAFRLAQAVIVLLRDRKNVSSSFPNRREARGLGWLGLLVTLGFTLGLWRYSSLDVERQEADRFRQLAAQWAAELTERMRACERLLRGTTGLFAASEVVTREEFRRYIAQLDLDEVLPGNQGVGFAAVIPRASLAAHERSVRAEGFSDYTVHPVYARDVYTSIVFLEPFAGRNLRAFGYDMYSEPTRRAAMNRARDTATPAMTHKVRLVQETGSDVQPGFLLYMPVYARNQPTSTLLERRRALAGWVYSPFRAFDLVDAVFAGAADDTEVVVFDGAPDDKDLLYASPAAARVAEHTVDIPIDVAGVRWTARIRSSEAFEERVTDTQPQVVLLGGTLLSVLIAAVLFVDSLHRRRLEHEVHERTAQLVAARDEAESASRAKSAFLATVSHELRTPLNAIIGFSSVLLQGDVTPEQRKQLAIINRSGLRLLELIREILDITSIEAGHLYVQIAPVDLSRLLAEQCDAVQEPAREAGLYVKLVDCDPSLQVMADAGRLTQIVRNLLANAVKFTDRGGVTVRCRREGATALVEIEDTGIGIAPEHRAALFKPFQRAVKGRDNRPGTGLGLAISRRLIEAMGGSIGFESEVDRGSRFWFTLPLAEARELSASRERPA